MDICKHGKETNRYSKKSQQNIISFRIVKDLSPLKGSISRSLHEKSFNLYSHTRTILHLRGIKFFSSSQRCTKNDFAHVPFLLYPSYAFAHIRANALLLVHYCVLMVSRNGVTSRRQFSLFSSTASLYSTLLPFSLSLSPPSIIPSPSHFLQCCQGIFTCFNSLLFSRRSFSLGVFLFLFTSTISYSLYLIFFLLSGAKEILPLMVMVLFLELRCLL